MNFRDYIFKPVFYAAYMELPEKLITKEALDEVGYDNRDAGIERTYALTGTPQINAFGFSR